MTTERLWPSVVVGWLLASAVLVAVSVPAIAQLWFPDPDDAMRLVEVRDWLAGQSWWDVGQHRLNGGDFPMHWSRLVDLPLAAVMIVADPLVGIAASNRIAVTVVPLVTLLAVIVLGATLTRTLAGTERARMAVLLAPLSVPLIYQVRPMRIDHHGWQVALALAAVVAIIGVANARRGVIAGVALAALVTISLEGLPITVAIVGIAASRWTLQPERRPQLLAMSWSLVGGVVALHVATRGPAVMAPACDAIAPGWIAALIVAGAGMTISTLLPLRAAWLRVGALGVTGVGALATLLLMSPDCARGPFATLDPLVYTMWYRNVSEGLPIQDQVPAWALMTIGFPLAGLAGTIMAVRSSTGPARAEWVTMLALLAASTLLALLVMRTGATANALALPGGAVLLQALLTRARAVTALGTRIAATAGALIASTPGLAAFSLFGLPNDQPAPTTGAPTRPACESGHEIADLAALPTSTLFAPVDVTPALIAWTPHRAIAGGYHRNAPAIGRVFRTFLGSPAAARRIIAESGAFYVVGCPGEAETELYKHMAPNGFWAQLERGERFDWLQPVTIPNSPVLAWRVIDPTRATLPLDRMTR